MDIDARGMDVQELMNKLKEMLTSKRECYLSFEILISALKDAKKVSAFLAMSGLKSEIVQQDDHYIMRISGISCCT